MKRISLLTALMLFACMSFAQMTRLSETTVVSPTFKGHAYFNYDENLNRSPICQYMAQEIDGENIMNQGVVAVLFTVNKDGTVSDFSVENSVSQSADHAVIKCLESTSGYWTPGLVNGTPAQMQRKIFVHFYDPEKGSLEHQGNENLQLAIKKYYSALAVERNVCLSAQKADKKISKKLNSAVALLKTAERFIPAEPSVAFWQACTYQKKGDTMLSKQKLDEFNMMTSPAYHAQVETVAIEL